MDNGRGKARYIRGWNRDMCLEGIAATAMPGLIGSLAVGLSFAKALAWSMKLPFKGVNHMLAHLYAPQLKEPIDYPFIGLLVSGGHTVSLPC